MGAPNILSELVEAGILTQSEADAVTAYQKEQMAQRQGQMQAALTERIRGELSALVSQGIISQEKADAMLAFYTDWQNSVQEEREKLKNMTDEERKAYLDGKKEEISQNGREKRAPGTELVEAGILTQDEVDAIVNYYTEQAGAKRQEAIEEKLLALVSDSTITDGQKDAILAALKEGAWMPKTGITDKTQKPAGRMNPLQALVEDGTLTQAQADTVAKALFGMGRGPGRPTGEGLAAKEI